MPVRFHAQATLLLAENPRVSQRKLTRLCGGAGCGSEEQPVKVQDGCVWQRSLNDCELDTKGEKMSRRLHLSVGKERSLRMGKWRSTDVQILVERKGEVVCREEWLNGLTGRGNAVWLPVRACFCPLPCVGVGVGVSGESSQ